MTPRPAGLWPPTNELVAVAWLSACDGIEQGQVATTLPKPVDGTLPWADAGFLQVQALPAGSPNIDVPVRRPVLQVDAWAPGGKAPQWALANRLIELVRLATEAAQTPRYDRPVTMRPGFTGARVLSVFPLTEPARVLDDPSGYARYTMDLALHWVPDASLDIA